MRGERTKRLCKAAGLRGRAAILLTLSVLVSEAVPVWAFTAEEETVREMQADKDYLSTVSDAVLEVRVEKELKMASAGQNKGIVKEDSYGENIRWSLDQSGQLKIWGNGAMPDSETWTNVPWSSDWNRIKEVAVEEGVTVIGAHVFDNCNRITTVKLPESVERIGDYAFRYCGGLISIKLPEGVKEIGEGAFCACTNLMKVEMTPENIESIQEDAFDGCRRLEDGVVVFKGSCENRLFWEMTSDGVLTVSGEGAIPDGGGGKWTSPWGGIEGITSVVIEEGITAVGRTAFSSCPMVSLKLPESLTRIGEYAFNYCTRLVQVDLPDGVKRIEENAFSQCGELTKVKLPKDLEKLDLYAFAKCPKLAEASLPSGIRRIGWGAFHDTAIESAVVPISVDFFAQSVYPDGTKITYGRADDIAAKPLELTGSKDFAVSNNKHGQNSVLAPWDSYLWGKADGGIYRIEHIGEKVVIEEYDSRRQFVKSWNVPMELPLFGGFYGGDDEFYLVFGQRNREENDDREVIRVVKYSKNMERLASVSLFGLNTTVPFSTSNLRMDMKDEYLYIHTGHVMYKTAYDGITHQANLTIVINTEGMVTSYENCGISTGGYVSHSFDQFVRVDGDQLVTVDLGDASPRAVAVFRHSASNMQAGPSGRNLPLHISGKDGANYTGVSLGGFEVSDSSYLVAGASVDQGNWNNSQVLNVFLTATDKNHMDQKAEYIQVTNYKEDGDRTADCPRLVKLSEDLFVLMWEEQEMPVSRSWYAYEYTGQVKAAFFDGSGAQLGGGIASFEGSLSDCQPVVQDGKVIWYVTDRDSLTFYEYPARLPENISAMTVNRTVLKVKKSDNEPEGGQGGENAGNGGSSGSSTGSGSSGGSGNSSGSGNSGSTGSGSGGGSGSSSGSGNSGSTGSGNSGGSGNSSGSGNSGSSGGGTGSGSSGGFGGSTGSGSSGSSGSGTGGGSSGSSGGSSGSGSGGGSGSSKGPGSGKGDKGNSSSLNIKQPDSVLPGQVPVLTGLWQKDRVGWWLVKPDGSYPRNQWAKINGEIYHFNDAGYMEEGWVFLNGCWYYLQPGSGAMAVGWVQASGKWYYLNSDGAMAIGWIWVSGKWYYLNPDGAMAVGWVQVSGKWYYLNSDGAMLANTITPDHYVVGPDGAWIP